MARRVTQLPTRTKRDTTSQDVLLLSNKDTGNNFQIPITEVFPKLRNGQLTGASSNTATDLRNAPSKVFVGGGAADTTTGVDNNTLVFKGLRIDYAGSSTAPSTLNHNSPTSPLSLFTETKTNESTEGNLLLGWDASNYGLSNFNNDSGFLTAVNLATNVTGSLPVTNGGTGLSAAAKGSVLVATDTNTLSALTPSGNGKLLITNATTGYPAWNTLTAGTNVSITETAGAITISSSIGSISGTLDMDNNNIDLGTGWLSGDGSNEGIQLDGDGKVFIGESTPTAYFSSGLNVATGISLGRSTGGSNQTIDMKATTSGASANLTIHGSNASGTGNAGGHVIVSAGDGDGNGDGGTLYLDSGVKAGTGDDGDIVARIAGAAALSIDHNKNVTVDDGNLTLTAGNLTATDGNVVVTAADHGLVHTGMGAVTQGTTAGFVDGVTINATSGRITLCSTCTLAGDSTASFVVTNSLVTINSLILLTLFDKTGAANARYSVSLGNQGTGTFTILLHNQENSGTTAGVMKVNFLVIN